MWIKQDNSQLVVSLEGDTRNNLYWVTGKVGDVNYVELYTGCFISDLEWRQFDEIPGLSIDIMKFREEVLEGITSREHFFLTMIENPRRIPLLQAKYEVELVDRNSSSYRTIGMDWGDLYQGGVQQCLVGNEYAITQQTLELINKFVSKYDAVSLNEDIYLGLRTILERVDLLILAYEGYLQVYSLKYESSYFAQLIMPIIEKYDLNLPNAERGS